MKQMQAHVEELVKDVTQLRHDKMRLETLLLEREDELTSLQEKFVSKLRPSKSNSSFPPQSSEQAQDGVWSKVKVFKRKPGEKLRKIVRRKYTVCTMTNLTMVVYLFNLQKMRLKKKKKMFPGRRIVLLLFKTRLQIK
ncbi:hypothetical protein V8G54_006733 [Vigna mungo]|uniref:Uncharacterized protein n=1 Tax=Vigna mungo TaxID=3915 RepID=A0AAQ3S895_VIGMU